MESQIFKAERTVLNIKPWSFVCQQWAVGIPVLGVNGEREECILYFPNVFLAHPGQIEASEDFHLSPCAAQEQASPS